MDPTCISAATILRCLSLTKGQNIAFIAPVAMEFLASCLLIFFKWGSGKQHLLLVAEGWIYFILALIELCSVIPSLSEDNVELFRSFDLGIGIASFLPVVLYILYLYLFTRKELLANLPKYVIKAAKISMFLALPLIFITNEVASSSKITITLDINGKIPSSSFSNKHGEWLWLFFTALTLAMLTAYQATVFSLAFFRLIWILVQQRRGQYDTRVGGIGWVSGGLKLGALEAIVGFAGGRFEISMTRRILRFMGRACLCIGTIIGVDHVTEDSERSYDNLDRPKKNASRRQTNRSLRMMISDPRFSTFQELSPMATGFHSALKSRPLQTSPEELKPPHYLTFSQRQRKRNEESISRFANLMVNNNPNQRVTVLYDVEGGPPSLQMRFSVLDVPLNVGTQERGNDVNNKRRSVKPIRISPGLPPLFEVDDPLPLPNAPFAQEGQRNNPNRESASSTASSMVEIIDVPRRTISQRLAAARLFHARSRDEFTQMSKDNSPFISDSESQTSQQYREPNPEPFGSISTLNGTHARTDTQSISIKSISDSIQAVQELACQFPTLPSPSSLDGSLIYGTPAERTGVSSRQSGLFAFAIGSPSDLEGSRQHSFARVSRLSLLPPSNGHSRQPSEEDIARTPRHGHTDSGHWTPSSSHTRDTARPVNYDAVPPLNSITPQGPSHSVGFGPLKPSGDAMRISEWVDDSPNIEFHGRMPQRLDNRGGVQIPVHSRPFIVTGPRTMGRVPTVTVPITHRSSLRERVGSNMKPIVIPSRKPNLPKAVQCWDGVP